jgi:hypothetical protein
MARLNHEKNESKEKKWKAGFRFHGTSGLIVFLVIKLFLSDHAIFSVAVSLSTPRH